MPWQLIGSDERAPVPRPAAHLALAYRAARTDRRSRLRWAKGLAAGCCALLLGAAPTHVLAGPPAVGAAARSDGSPAAALCPPGSRDGRLAPALQEAVARSRAFPAQTRVEAACLVGATLRVDLDLGQAIDHRQADGLVDAATRVLGSAAGGVRTVYFRLRDTDGAFRSLPELLPVPAPVPDKKPVARSGGGTAVDAPGVGQGALAGKTVYLSQCHGWLWSEDADAWLTQRPNLFDTVEDFHNPEATNQYLMRYLLNAGARVITVREPDLTTAMVIVDDADPGYEEVGSPSFEPSGQAGFASGQAPYDYGENPFDAGADRVVATAATATASARWTPNLSADGHYHLYVSYSQGSSRAPDAHYVVHHPGGDTDIRVDQRSHGSTWAYLGRFWLQAGTDASRGSVELLNDSSVPGAVVSADAVRFGGGMGDVLRAGGASGQERWEEAAIYYTQFAGAPPDVYDPWGDGDGSDPSCRSRFAAWEHEAGEDALYLSWHSNATGSGGGASGTSTYVYSECDVGYDCTFSGVAGSDRFAELVHENLLAAIRALWDPQWTDQGLHTAWFAEVNPDHNPEMPAALVELAFHDDAYDADLLKHPQFRRDAARAMLHGIIDYFADRDSVQLEHPPEPPTHLRITATGRGRLTVRWSAPPAGAPLGGEATGYRLYSSLDGRSYDNGTAVAGTEAHIEALDGYEPLFVRVTATNDGGESFPTPTLGAIPTPTETRILLVDGFDRLDRGLLLWRDEGGAIGERVHMDLERMNRYDYAVEHLWALAALPVPVDAVESEAIADGSVAADGYDLVVWFAGQESTTDETFSAAEQAWVAELLESGGRLFVSGGEIGWDLFHAGDEADQQFYRQVLRAELAADDAETLQVAPVAGGIFDAVPPLELDDGTGPTYEARYPDVLTVQSGAEPALLYDGDTARPAALASDDRQLVYLGFPFETILGDDARAAVMAAAFAWLWPGYLPPSWELEQDAGTGGTGGSGGGASGVPTGETDDGCGCRVASRRSAPGSLALGSFALAVGLLVARGRRVREASATDRLCSGRS